MAWLSNRDSKRDRDGADIRAVKRLGGAIGRSRRTTGGTRAIIAVLAMVAATVAGIAVFVVGSAPPPDETPTDDGHGYGNSETIAAGNDTHVCGAATDSDCPGHRTTRSYARVNQPASPLAQERLAPITLSSAQPVAPIRAAFFYPWFPEAWDQSGINPFTQFTPSLGFYDSENLATIDQEIALSTG